MTVPVYPIYVTNASTVCTDDEVRTMTAACDAQIQRDVAPAWGRVPSPVVYSAKTSVPRGGWVISVVDTDSEPDAAGWHTDDGGTQGVHGVVAARVWLDHGGTKLQGANSVSVTLSHEVCELFCDAHCNAWRDTGQGWSMIQEVCDPVEGDCYSMNGVSVSNFVWPFYFDPTPATGAQFDQLKRLRKPFSMSKGGYFEWMQAGKTGQKFGSKVPDFVKELKQRDVSRFSRVTKARRMVSAPPEAFDGVVEEVDTSGPIQDAVNEVTFELRRLKGKN